MKHLRMRILAVMTGLLCSVAGGCAATAQETAPRLEAAAQMADPATEFAPPQTFAMQPKSVGGVLRSLALRAGVVFVGQVQAIRPNGGVTEIVFHVLQPVVGDVSETYTLREWSGRWTGGQQHYHVGQRSMIFLYAPNAAGLSSPVDGMAGVVPLIPMGANADPLLDVRWLATHVQRAEGEPIADADFGAVALADAVAVVTGDNKELPREPVKRPLPIGLRPRPIVMPGVDVAADAQANLPSIVQVQGGNDVEH